MSASKPKLQIAKHYISIGGTPTAAFASPLSLSGQKRSPKSAPTTCTKDKESFKPLWQGMGRLL